MQGGPSGSDCTRIADHSVRDPVRAWFCAIIEPLLQPSGLLPVMKNQERKTHDAEIDAEKIAAIRKIRKLMDFWRISPNELRGRPAVVPRPSATPQEIRYCHPVSGDTWDGQGVQPQWLREALLREGYTVDELRQAAQARQVATEVGAG